MTEGPSLSIVTSTYGTARFLKGFVSRAAAAAESAGHPDYEIIVVIDGAEDGAQDVLRRLKAAEPRLRCIDLSRNFGHHAALWCGLEAARGGLIFLADSDLEVAPEVLADLARPLADPDVDVAFAVHADRPRNTLDRLTSAAFWRLFAALSGVKIPAGLATERLMRRRYVDALLTMGDRALFLAGMMQWIGFCQVAVPVARTPRTGPRSYSYGRRMALAFDALTSFSDVPMKVLFWGGLLLAALGFGIGFALAVVKLMAPATVAAGYTSVVVLILGSLGTIVAAVGLVGLYLGKIFLQTKRRPIYVIRDEF